MIHDFDNQIPRIFRCAVASLYEGVSLRPSVRPSPVIFKRVLGASCAVYSALFPNGNGRKDIRTDLPSYRDARTHLNEPNHIKMNRNDIQGSTPALPVPGDAVEGLSRSGNGQQFSRVSGIFGCGDS